MFVLFNMIIISLGWGEKAGRYAGHLFVSPLYVASSFTTYTRHLIARGRLRCLIVAVPGDFSLLLSTI